MNMLRLSEHYQFYTPFNKHRQIIEDQLGVSFLSTMQSCKIDFGEFVNKEPCVELKVNGEGTVINSSYFIGLDWLPETKIPVLVAPKLNTGTLRVNHIMMLVEALSTSENLEHLKDLMEIKFDQEWIDIKDSSSVLITPFLLIEFLMSVREIVRNGLKKDYYTITKSLTSNIKGKIDIAKNLRTNTIRGRKESLVCNYQIFDIDHNQNMFIKYVLIIAGRILEDFPTIKGEIVDIYNYTTSAFKNVTYKEYFSYDKREANPLYKNYNLATKLGNQILKLKNQNLSFSGITSVKYPPHWIDMSKLFELYVFKKLKTQFPSTGEVAYHQKVNRQEPDFILNTASGLKAIVDTKYKPRYKTGNPSMEDARQLAGYTRLNSVYKMLDIDINKVIPAYFIYPKVLAAESVKEKELEDYYTIPEACSMEDKGLLEDNIRSSSTYTKMYLEEIALPQIK